ncbi:MAG TPA: response regulator transcription factor [Ardenticatenaceae bacterium]|nr:response regulator transcription factor [Ardenticatenaceae bacterium]
MKILVVDDDAQLAGIIGFTLRREGFLVLEARDGEAALDVWEREQPDLVLLDVNLPRVNGYEVLARIRVAGRTPVIMLTVRGDEEDVVRGLDLGADDYVAKPFSPKTLLARIRAVLRRGGLAPSGDLVAGDLCVDVDRQEARIDDGPPVKLTPLEYRLLHYLMVNRGTVLSSDAIIEHVWGYGDSGDRMLLKQLVRRLRRKIEADPANPRYVETIPNVGYTFAADTQAAN